MFPARWCCWACACVRARPAFSCATACPMTGAPIAESCAAPIGRQSPAKRPWRHLRSREGDGLVPGAISSRPQVSGRGQPAIWSSRDFRDRTVHWAGDDTPGRGASAAAADAFELGVQQLVAFVGCRLGIGVLAVAAIACELRSVHSVAAKTPAKSVTTSCISRERRCRQKRRAQAGCGNGRLRRARHLEQFLPSDHLEYDSALKVGIEAPSDGNFFWIHASAAALARWRASPRRHSSTGRRER